MLSKTKIPAPFSEKKNGMFHLHNDTLKFKHFKNFRIYFIFIYFLYKDAEKISFVIFVKIFP